MQFTLLLFTLFGKNADRQAGIEPRSTVLSVDLDTSAAALLAETETWNPAVQFKKVEKQNAEFM